MMISVQGRDFLVTAYPRAGDVQTVVSMMKEGGVASGSCALLAEMAGELTAALRVIEAAAQTMREETKETGAV